MTGEPVGEDSPAVGAEILARIQRSRAVAERELDKFRRRSKLLTYASVICSALASLLAGFAAAAGPPLGDGPPAWKLTCGVVACFTASSGVLTGVQQAGNVAHELAKASANASRLAGLEFGFTVLRRDSTELAKEYEEVVLQNPHLYVA